MYEPNNKVLIYSDLHIHPHKRSYDRLQDCLDVQEWVFKTARDLEIENILFCGDLFHDRQKMDIPTYQKTFDCFRRNLERDDRPNVFLLLGNHDLWHYQKWDVSCVFPLGALPGVTVVDRPCALKVGNYEVGFLPYTHDPIEDLKKIKMKAKFKMLCAHVAVDGAVWNVRAGTKSEVSIEHDGDMIKITPDVFDKFDQVFLGHYHGEQKLSDTVEYVGSPLQLSFGEAFEKKHIVVYDLETHEKEYIRNNFSPEHYIVPADKITKEMLERENFMRVIVDDLAAANVIEMKNEISKTKVKSLEIKQKPKQVAEEVQIISDAKSILAKGDEMLVGYCESEEVKELLKDLDKPKLLDIGREICQVYQGT